MSKSLRSLAILISLIILSAGGVHAQWTNVAPGLVPAATNLGGGAIVYKQGIVWAGTRQIYMSTNEGLSWEIRNSPMANGDYIRHIDFYNDSIGLLASNLGDTWITFDQAITWKRIRNTGSAYAARFVNSPRNIVIAGASTGLLDVTTDGGQTWKSTVIGSFVPFIVPLTGGTVYALIATDASRTASRLYISSDYGLNWTAAADTAGFDSYTFAVDQCSPERVYIANEDAGSPSNSMDHASDIYVSSNTGNSWTTTYSKAGKDLVGSITLASNSIYVQRLNDGILRSTDFGNTWKDIGGPTMYFDSRMLCAITDNVILAADAAGDLWRTTNSGGDSVHGETRYQSISSTPDMLFNWDTLFSCDPPTFDTLIINSVYCQPPRVVRVEIEGDHPLDFKLTSTAPKLLTGSDTLAFEFMPRGNGERRANLRITFEDSTSIVVPMRGFGKGVTELAMTSADGATDTLGAVVYLPISYESKGEMTGVTMDVSYTSDQLEFVDVYDLLGVTVATPTADPKRFSLLFPSPIAQNGLIGHAAFRVYSGPEACMPVLFDSIKVLSTRPVCAFAINPKMEAKICVPNDCVAIRVSDYLRYGKLPKLNVIQTGSDLVLTSDVNFGDVQVRLINMLGVVEATHADQLRSDKPMRFSVQHLAEGMYFVQLQSALGARVIKLVMQP